jgi:hypothetical protein
MLVILGLYAVLVWVLFSKLKIVKWGWLSGGVTVMVGALILAVFMALLNSLAPSGRITAKRTSASGYLTIAIYEYTS